MSVDLESAKRLASLKSGIEAKTGESYTDLTAGVNALIAGYGSSGVSLDSVAIYVGDYYADELNVEIGALDKYERIIVT